ncbi:MAG: cobyrinate a,c-diamide synthase [Armatimonadetes bacterium]|nr:cobyrinate a,c-diamide synthase [Armatimonadota bacterium]
MMAGCPRIVIGGVESGAGKTSVTLALVATLRRRGIKVQTYKVGPDFLDPSHLAQASGRPCYNLDGWMMGREYVERLFARTAGVCDLAVIEGVMGLFDGADPTTSEGSTAEIARWLKAPVLLVVSAQGMARSLAALVKGYAEFEPGVNIAGVIANQCGSARHAELLADSLKVAQLPPLIGGVPHGAFPELRSRHLGLITADGRNTPKSVLDRFADAVDQNLPVDEVIRLAQSAPPLPAAILEPAPVKRPVRIGVAYDEAFHFYYQDLFDELEMRGCELVRFSPVGDAYLPAGLDAIYFGGGYPELYAEALTANQGMRDEVRRFAAHRPIYSECGGLMYLAQQLETVDGRQHPMIGLLPTSTRMLNRLKALGYIEVTLNEASLWGEKGAVLRGHQYHYSELIGDPLLNPNWKTVYTLRWWHRNATECEGFQSGSVLASYVHLHLASKPAAMEHFIGLCKRWW